MLRFQIELTDAASRSFLGFITRSIDTEHQQVEIAQYVAEWAASRGLSPLSVAWDIYKIYND